MASLVWFPNYYAKTLVVIGRKDELSTTSIDFTNSSEGPKILDEQNPAAKVIIKSKEIPKSIIDSGSGVNVISKETCDRVGIKEWEVSILASDG